MLQDFREAKIPSLLQNLLFSSTRWAQPVGLSFRVAEIRNNVGVKTKEKAWLSPAVLGVIAGVCPYSPLAYITLPPMVTP